MALALHSPFSLCLLVPQTLFPCILSQASPLLTELTAWAPLLCRTACTSVPSCRLSPELHSSPVASQHRSQTALLVHSLSEWHQPPPRVPPSAPPPPLAHLLELPLPHPPPSRCSWPHPHPSSQSELSRVQSTLLTLLKSPHLPLIKLLVPHVTLQLHSLPSFPHTPSFSSSARLAL